MPKSKKTPEQKAKEFKTTYGYDQKDETKKQAFSRIASRRTDNALTAIRMLEPLASKANYESTPEQANKIVVAMQEAVSHVKDVFAGKTSSGKAGFQV